MSGEQWYRWSLTTEMAMRRVFGVDSRSLIVIRSPISEGYILNPLSKSVGASGQGQITYYEGVCKDGEKRLFASIVTPEGRTQWLRLDKTKKVTATAAREIPDSLLEDKWDPGRGSSGEYASGNGETITGGDGTPYLAIYGPLVLKYGILAALGGAATYAVMKDSPNRVPFAAGGAALAAGSVFLLGPGGPLRPGA